MIETKFKESEFGSIPKDWRVAKFEDVLKTFSSGATPYRGIQDNFKGDIRWITSGELNYNIIEDTIEHISETARRNTNLTIHPEGTFLMAITGLEAAGTRGKCAFVGKPSTTNQSCLAINSTNKMITKYLYWFYRMYSDYLAFKYCQGTKQQSYTASIVKQLPIFFPESIEEQNKIAENLSNMDSLISQLNKLIEKKRAIKQGAMQELLTGKRRLPGFSEPWESTRLGDVLCLRNGYAFKSEFYSKNGKFKIITIANVQNGRLDLSDFSTVSIVPEDIQRHQILCYGDILISMTGNIGRVCKVDQPNCLLNQRVGLLEFKENINRDFLYVILNTERFESAMRDKGQGAAQANIGKCDIENHLITIPSSKEEQAKLASILMFMDDELSNLVSKRDKYIALKQGMMQQLLTGKIRLI